MKFAVNPLGQFEVIFRSMTTGGKFDQRFLEMRCLPNLSCLAEITQQFQ